MKEPKKQKNFNNNVIPSKFQKKQKKMLKK